VIFYRVRDDAGRVVRLHPIGLGAGLSLAARQTSGRRVAIALAQLTRLIKSGRLLSVLGTLALLAMIGVLVVFETAVGIWMLVFSPIISTLLVAMGGLFVAAMALSRRVGPGVVRAMLARRRCPACNYDLASLGVGAQRVVCPECAATWNAAGLGNEAVPEPELVIVKWGGR